MTSDGSSQPKGASQKDGQKKRGERMPQPKKAPKGTPSEDLPRRYLYSQLRKTKLCAYYISGSCTYGKTCAFAHSWTELQSLPDLRKTRLCPKHQNGECRDPSCPFAHGEEELCTTNMFFKKNLCTWFQKGKCRNGESCRFAHGAHELRHPAEAAQVMARAAEAAQMTGSSHSQEGSTASDNSTTSTTSFLPEFYHEPPLPAMADEPMKVHPSRDPTVGRALPYADLATGGYEPAREIPLPEHLQASLGRLGLGKGVLPDECGAYDYATILTEIQVLSKKCDVIRECMALMAPSSTFPRPNPLCSFGHAGVAMDPIILQQLAASVSMSAPAAAELPPAHGLLQYGRGCPISVRR